MSGTVATENNVIVPQDSELNTLSQAIQEWRRISDEIKEHQQEIK